MNLYKIFVIAPCADNISAMWFKMADFQFHQASYQAIKDQIEDILITIKFQICVTSHFFQLYDDQNEFWTKEKKQKLRIVFKSDNLSDQIDRIKYLLQQKFCIDILVENPSVLAQLNSLNSFAASSSSLRLCILDSFLFQTVPASIFDSLMSGLHAQIYFLYRPVSEYNENCFRPPEVLSILKKRRQECAVNNVALKIISIVNEQSFKKSSYKKVFYLNPNAENYLKTYSDYHDENKNSFSENMSKRKMIISCFLNRFIAYIISAFSYGSWKLKHLFWIIEELFEKGTLKLKYYIKQAYWKIRPGVGYLRLAIIDIFWVTKSSFLNSRIVLLRKVGLLFGKTVDLFWLGVKPAINGTWKIYSMIRHFISVLHNHSIKIYWFIKRRSDFVTNIFIVTFWFLRKKLDVIAEKSVQFFWITKSNISSFILTCEKVYWFFKKKWNQIIILSEHIIWEMKKSKYLYPFFKMYWFVKFQFKKRILDIFKKR